jgi:hypothetical protein
MARSTETSSGWSGRTLCRVAGRLALFGVLGTPACAANQDVKTASTEVTKTITATRAVEKDFAKALVSEVDNTAAQVERALASRIVYAQIQAIALDLENKGDLIGLSKKISEAETRAAKFLEVVGQAKPPADLAKADMEAWVRSFAPEGAPPLAKLGVDPEELRTLLTLYAMRKKAEQVNSQLDTHLAAMTALHAQVDLWIQTDVTVKGEDVAAAIKAVAARFPETTAAAATPAVPR